MGVLEQIGHDECGQLPFYYNRRTGQAVCGATSYMNLKRWAIGDLKAVFMDPPESLNRADEENFRNKRDIGTKGSLMESFKTLERRGKNQQKQKEEEEQKRQLDRKGGKKMKQNKSASKGSDARETGQSKPLTSAAARTAARKAEREAKRPKESARK